MAKSVRKRAKAVLDEPVTVDAKPPWKWRCRKDDRGVDVIDEWHNSIEVTKTARANFERRRDQLSQLDFRRWERPAACQLKDHICVIHFKDESSKQWRVFGYSAPESKTFVMTNVATEKDDVYKPKKSAKHAANHRDAIRIDFDRLSCGCFPSATAAK